MSLSTLSSRLATRATSALALAAATLLGACQDSPTAVRASPAPRASAERAPIATLVGDTTEPILYAHRTPSGPWQIFRIRQDKSDFTQITSGAEHFDPTRTWLTAKVNDRLAYVERISATQSRVIVANLDGTNAIAVTPYLRDVRHPSFRWDGKALTFAALVPYPGGQTYHHQIFTVGASGGSMARVTYDNDDDTYPFWRSSTQLVFIGGAAGQRQLFGIAPTGGAVLQMTAYTSGDMSSMAMSRNGQNFAFVLNKGTVIRAIGDVFNGEVVKPGGLTETYADPAFAPDDRAIAFIDKDGGSSRLLRVNVNGTGGFVYLNKDGYNDMAPAWGR